MLPEEKFIKSKELLDMNRNKIESARVNLSQKMTLLKQYRSQLDRAKNILEKSNNNQLVTPQTEVAKTQRKSPQNLRNTPLLTTEAVDFLENFLKQKPDANVLE
ncbi:MAG: hypothetical protein WBA93_09790, partial [Microcoleaceae cyanobacterium]